MFAQNSWILSTTHQSSAAFTLLVRAPFEYTTQLIIPSLHLSPKPLIVSFTLSIPRLITLPLVSLLSNSPLHSLSCPLILSRVCLINLSSHSVTYSRIHMRHTRPTIDTIALRMWDGKWMWPIYTGCLSYCRPVKPLLFSWNFSIEIPFTPHPFFVPISALPVLLEHFSFFPSSPRSSSDRLHTPHNFSVTELFISLISFLP